MKAKYWNLLFTGVVGGNFDSDDFRQNRFCCPEIFCLPAYVCKQWLYLRSTILSEFKHTICCIQFLVMGFLTFFCQLAELFI